jgi:hypothetical protein
MTVAPTLKRGDDLMAGSTGTGSGKDKGMVLGMDVGFSGLETLELEEMTSD